MRDEPNVKLKRPSTCTMTPQRVSIHEDSRTVAMEVGIR